MKRRSAFERAQLEGVCREGWTQEKDSQAFALMPFNLVADQPENREATILDGIPDWVSMRIESTLIPTSQIRYSFTDIF
jgi:hypothetical protein